MDRDQTLRSADADGSVVASGFAAIDDYTDKLAANEFFQPGRLFAVRVKHASFPGQLSVLTLRR